MVTEIRDNVKTGIRLETVSSEHEVSPILTHEVAMYLNTLDNDEERIADIADAATQAIMGLHDSVAPFHPYVVREATRGILHGLVCAGMDISYVTRPAAKGIREALFLLDEFSRENEQALRRGVRDALEDLGLSRIEDDRALELPEYFANETIVFGRAAF
jgi:hypothetical protein